MKIILAYISVVLLWSTTPLAIKYSSEGAGFLFSATARMSIGLFCLLLLLAITRQCLVWHKRAIYTYLAVALQIYGSMLAVYWSAQFIPSGWVSLIAGLMPLMTALLAALLLAERSLSMGKVLSYLLGFCGLIAMFGSALELGRNAVLGVGGMLLAVFLQSLSSIWVKQANAQLPALIQVTGGLFIALPTYFITWRLFDNHIPMTMPVITAASILYLGIIATTIGFSFYYFLLTHLPATRVALISLIAPPLALFLGHALNHEPITLNIIIGALFIFAALIIHDFFDVLFSRKRV
ncbi:MAG: DMT family transporter [Methylococcaceae bacterium]